MWSGAVCNKKTNKAIYSNDQNLLEQNWVSSKNTKMCSGEVCNHNMGEKLQLLKDVQWYSVQQKTNKAIYSNDQNILEQKANKAIYSNDVCAVLFLTVIIICTYVEYWWLFGIGWLWVGGGGACILIPCHLWVWVSLHVVSVVGRNGSTCLA